MLGFNASTGRTTTVSIPNYVAYAPEGYFIGSTWVSSSQTILSWQFTGDFKMEDRKGTTGWYTTIQLPNYMSGTTYQNNVIGGNKIKFMATGTTLIEGTNTSSIYINPALTSGFTWFSAPVQYLKRDYAAESYYCPAGVYGNKPYISVDIPAYQNPDTYSGMITIDINN